VSRAATRAIESFSWSPMSRRIAARRSRSAKADRKERSALAKVRAAVSAALAMNSESMPAGAAH
jgi:hypothetical protein